MRHGVDGRKFGRNTSHRVAMLKNMANNLIKEERIVTTIEKAKEARRVAERLITLAKRDTLNSRRLAFDRTRDKAVVAKLFGELMTRYSTRIGGYTRIVKISETRYGDAAKMAMIELVDHPELNRKKKKPVAAEGAAGDPTEPAAANATVDPFAKMRKLFSGKKTEKTEKAPKVAKAPAAKRTTTVSKKSP